MTVFRVGTSYNEYMGVAESYDAGLRYLINTGIIRGDSFIFPHDEAMKSVKDYFGDGWITALRSITVDDFNDLFCDDIFILEEEVIR